MPSAQPAGIDAKLSARPGGILLLGVYPDTSNVSVSRARSFVHAVIVEGAEPAETDLRHGDRLGAAMAFLGSAQDVLSAGGDVYPSGWTG